MPTITRRRAAMLNNDMNSESAEQTAFLVQKEPFRLYTYDEIPEWQKDNHYILTGYVKETNSWYEVFRSLTYMHNESVNIYTHFLPGFILPVVLLLLYPFLSSNSNVLLKFCPIDIPIYASTSSMDFLVFYIFIAGFMSCLSLSASFHCFKCHSLEVSIFGNKLDYLGIVILIVTSMIGIIHYSLIDSIIPQRIFIGLTVSFGVVCTVVSVDSEFRTPEWRPFRAAMFVLFGLSSVFPIFYGFYAFGLDETFNRAGLKWVLLEGAGYIFGAFLYGVRFPERLSPGLLDNWGNSHQIFHVLVVLSAFSHFKGLIESYKYAHEVVMNGL